MDRKIKTIVKILLTVLMAIIILLILPKTENAYKSLTFNTPYSNFTIDGIPDGDYGSTANHFYELAHDLANSSSIEEFDNNNSNKWYYPRMRNDLRRLLPQIPRHCPYSISFYNYNISHPAKWYSRCSEE